MQSQCGCRVDLLAILYLNRHMSCYTAICNELTCPVQNIPDFMVNNVILNKLYRYIYQHINRNIYRHTCNLYRYIRPISLYGMNRLYRYVYFIPQITYIIPVYLPQYISIYIPVCLKFIPAYLPVYISIYIAV